MTPYSVLMSVYHKENPDFLKSSIESTLNQTVQPSDFVIVCDGPLTESLDAILDEYALRLPRLFQLLRLVENKGQGIALQKGIELCKNEFIARMDSDDINVPDRCEMQLKAFDDNPELSLIGGQIDEFETNPELPYASRKVPLSYGEIVAFAKKRNPFNHMTVMFKKTAVLNAGNYQSFMLFEDYWLWIRILQSGIKAQNLPQTLVKVRAGKGMLARRGGWDYAKKHVAFQKAIYKMGFLSRAQFLSNVFVRVSASIAPSWARKLLYNKALRS